MCLKSWKYAQDKIQTKEENKDNFDPSQLFQEEIRESIYEEIKETERETMLSLVNGENLIDIATPYKIRNLTGINIFVETFFEGKDDKNYYFLNNGETVKVAVNFDHQTKNNTTSKSAKLNEDVRIQFEGLFLPTKSM
jgi:hypothetical protein